MNKNLTNPVAIIVWELPLEAQNCFTVKLLKLFHFSNLYSYHSFHTAICKKSALENASGDLDGERGSPTFKLVWETLC